jgi:hypothetical protein
MGDFRYGAFLLGSCLGSGLDRRNCFDRFRLDLVIDLNSPVERCGHLLSAFGAAAVATTDWIHLETTQIFQFSHRDSPFTAGFRHSMS